MLVTVVTMVAMVAGVETAQTGTTAISTLTVVEVVVRVLALNTAGSDCHLGVYADVSCSISVQLTSQKSKRRKKLTMVNVVVDVVMLVLDYRLFDDIGTDQGARRMMWVRKCVVNRRESGVTVAR